MPDSKFIENPYQSPVPVDETLLPDVDTFWALLQFSLATLFLSMFAGIAIGAGTNVINGWIYPWHFYNLAPRGANLWWVAVAVGIKEGGMYGLLNGGATAIIVACLRISSAKRPHPARIVMLGSCLTVVAWLIGGLTAIVIAWFGLQPTQDFYYAPGSGFWTVDRRWVLWSIRGAVWGSPFCSFLALVISLRQANRKSQPEPAP